MILAIDTGNTNIVFGCIDENGIILKGCISTDKNKTDVEYAVLFKNILDIHGVKKQELDGAIISSVVPPLTGALCGAVETVTGHKPVMVDAAADIGLKINMENKERMGHDLLVDSAAALAQFKPPILIFDMGTATTISVIDREGVYTGSVIMPGMKISQEALSARTSQLPSIAFEAPGTMLGKNTIDAMKIGLIHGNAAMMDGMIERLEEALGEKASVVATGGMAGCVVPFCRKDVVYDDDLLLKGLWLIYNKQKKETI